MTKAIEGVNGTSNAGLTKLAGDVVVGEGGSIKQEIINLGTYHLTANANSLNNSAINGLEGSLLELTGGDAGWIYTAGSVLTSSGTTNFNNIQAKEWTNNAAATLDMAPTKISDTLYIPKSIAFDDGVKNNGTLTIKGFEVDKTASDAMMQLSKILSVKFDISMSTGETDGVLNFERGSVRLGSNTTASPVEITITQKEINVKNGAEVDALSATLNAALNIENGGYASVDVNKTNGAIKNDGEMYLAGSSLTQNVTGNGLTRVGTAITNNALITQKDMIIYTESGLSSDVDKLSVTNAIQNGGTLTLTGTGDNTNAISNYVMPETTYEGTTIIAGNINNLAAINQAITVNGSKTLTTAANLIGGAVTNSGTVDLTGGALGQTITGGNITISATGDNAVTASVANLGGDITNNGNLLLSGTLNKNIAGTTGVTKLNDNMTFADGAGVAGTLNFNS